MDERISRTLKIIGGVAGVVLIGFFAARLRLSSADVSPSFAEARTRGAVIAEAIVNLSNDISRELEEVNKFDAEGKPREALALAAELRFKVGEIRIKAAELSEQLKGMVAELEKVNSAVARQAALDAITNRMALLSRLMSYGEYLDQLIEVLSHRFTEVPDATSVQVIIAQINAEVIAVSSFNRQANQAMERFDASL